MRLSALPNLISRRLTVLFALGLALSARARVSAADLEPPVGDRSASAGIFTPAPELARATASENGSGSAWENPTTGDSRLGHESDLSGYRQLGSFDEKVLMADFCPDEKGLLLATTDGSRIRIYRLQDGIKPVVTYRPPGFARIHSLRWWRPAPAAEPYLVVTATRSAGTTFGTTQELELNGLVLKLAAEQLIPVADSLDYLLGSFDRDGDGQRESLLGQSVELDGFFGHIKGLTFSAGRLKADRAAINFPPGFPAPAGLVADLTGTGELESIFVRKGMLIIARNGKPLVQFGKGLGGSLSQLTYDLNPGQSNALFTTVAFEVPPVAADLNGDGQLELLTVASEQATGFSLAGSPEIVRSRLVAFWYQQGSFRKSYLTEELDMPIQGIYVDKNRLLLVVVDPAPADAASPISRLLSVSLPAVSGGER